MSQENVGVVRLAYDYVSTGQDTATVLAIYDPEVEWDISQAPARHLLGEPHVFRGHAGLKKFFGAWYEAWDVVKPDLEELIDAGDQVIAIETTRGRGRASGLSVELPHVSVWTIRKGKIVRVQWFATRSHLRGAIPDRIGPGGHTRVGARPSAQGPTSPRGRYGRVGLGSASSPGSRHRSSA